MNRLFETGQALRDQVASFAPERLQELRSGVDAQFLREQSHTVVD